MLVIRPERTEDYAAVHEVHRLAFGRENEAQLVETLRQSTNFIPELSLVAFKNGRVVGHVLFSPIIIETQTDTVPALALAPVAVLPEFQNQGVGSELIRRGLKKCQRLGHKIVVVVGHSTYYSRFGFSSARAKRLEAPFQVSDEAFMALELTSKALNGIKGMIKYPLAFDEV
jgi:putative acetyltransferase